jgi:hypothetical protein
MGQQLEQWIEANSRTLQALAGPGQGIPPAAIPGTPGAPGAPQPAFGPQPAAAPPQAAFPQGATDYSGAFAPEPTPEQLATAQGAQPAAFDMPFMQPPAPGAAPPATQPATTGVAPKPRKDEGPPQMGFGDMYKEADPESISKVIDLLEQNTGRSVEDLYEQQTGRPPPRGTKKEKIGEFLLEFGLNLASAPAELSSFEAVGRSAKAAMATGRQRDVEHEQRLAQAEERRIAAQERAEGRLDKKFDRSATLERLSLERQRVQVALDKPIGTFENYIGEDGYWFTYNAQTDEGRRVMVNGKPQKAHKDAIANKQRRLDSEVRMNMYMAVHSTWPDGTPKTGTDLWKAKSDGLEYANRVKNYTRAEAVRDATKLAVPELLKDTDYNLADTEERLTMKRRLIAEYADSFMAGNSSDGAVPDESRLVEGIATAITNDAGITEYWMLKNGKATKVSESQLVR